MPTGLEQWLEVVPEVYRPWLIWGIGGLLILLVFRAIWIRAARFVRRFRPPKIHPLLQKYHIDHAELDRQRRKQAGLIIATSTGPRLVGFRIVRQVEAVFVEGYRSPEEALIALKAAAADRGANGMLNVRTERTTAGRCTASGDAIVVVPIELGRAGRTQLRADRATADETSPTPHKPSSEKPPEATDQSS